MLASDILVI